MVGNFQHMPSGRALTVLFGDCGPSLLVFTLSNGKLLELAAPRAMDRPVHVSRGKWGGAMMVGQPAVAEAIIRRDNTDLTNAPGLFIGAVGGDATACRPIFSKQF